MDGRGYQERRNHGQGGQPEGGRGYRKRRDHGREANQRADDTEADTYTKVIVKIVRDTHIPIEQAMDQIGVPEELKGRVHADADEVLASQ